MHLWLWITVMTAGAAGQFVDAVAGMGFGALSSSIMIAGGLSPAMVIGTVSLAKVGSGLISGLSHWQFGNVRRSWVVPLAIPGIAGGVVAGILVSRLSEDVSRLWVPAILVVMGLLILRRSLFPALDLPRVAGATQDWAPPAPRSPWYVLKQIIANLPTRVWLSGIGFLGGVLNGFSGAFGPFVTSSVMLLKGGHPRHAVGTVNFVEFFVAAAVAVTVFSQLNWTVFPWGVLLALMAGSAVTATLGAYLARHVPARGLYALVGLVLISLNAWNMWRSIG